MDGWRVSGFDAFGNVTDNPSKQIALELNGKIVQVSAKDADLAVEELSQGNHKVVIHLGVDQLATEIKLERFAYNSNK